MGICVWQRQEKAPGEKAPKTFTLEGQKLAAYDNIIECREPKRKSQVILQGGEVWVVLCLLVA
jgi:hypothetical protein